MCRIRSNKLIDSILNVTRSLKLIIRQRRRLKNNLIRMEIIINSKTKSKDKKEMTLLDLKEISKYISNICILLYYFE